MKRLLYSALTIVFAVSFFSINSKAATDDLFVLVSLLVENGRECSVLKVDPFGNLTEIVNNSEVVAAVDTPDINCSSQGIACAANGDVFFSDGAFGGPPGFPALSNILITGPMGGNLDLFVPNSAIRAVTGENEDDLDNGMALGPDGNLYAADNTSNSILKVTVPGGVVSTAITEAVIAAATGLPGADIQGGIAIDPDFNFYIADAESNSIVICRPGGPCTVLTTEAQFEEAAGVNNVTINDPILLVGDLLYVAEANNCNCVFVLDINTGVPALFLSEAQINAVLNGNLSDPGGGLAVDERGRIYIANNSEDSVLASILRTGHRANANQLSLFVSGQQVREFYGPDFEDINFDSGICFTPPPPKAVPTLSEWGMLAMAGVLGIIGLLFAMRKRTLST